jgi:hypothetical protein
VSSTKQQLKPRDISRNVENVCYFVGSLDWTKQVHVHRARGGKHRQALLAGNVKQLQEICLNEDLLLQI